MTSYCELVLLYGNLHTKEYKPTISMWVCFYLSMFFYRLVLLYGNLYIKEYKLTIKYVCMFLFFCVLFISLYYFMEICTQKNTSWRCNYGLFLFWILVLCFCVFLLVCLFFCAMRLQPAKLQKIFDICKYFYFILLSILPWILRR